MSYKNLDEEVLVSIYKNAHIALQSIADIIGEAHEESMKEELRYEHDGYDAFIGKISAYMKETGVDEKNINVFQKAFMFASIKMNTLTDDSKSHIAELMIKGTVTGITELTELINADGKNVSEKVRVFAEELRDLEENYEERLKKLL